jgi:hypothetical protein
LSQATYPLTVPEWPVSAFDRSICSKGQQIVKGKGRSWQRFLWPDTKGKLDPVISRKRFSVALQSYFPLMLQGAAVPDGGLTRAGVAAAAVLLLLLFCLAFP